MSSIRQFHDQLPGVCTATQYVYTISSTHIPTTGSNNASIPFGGNQARQAAGFWEDEIKEERPITEVVGGKGSSSKLPFQLIFHFFNA